MYHCISVKKNGNHNATHNFVALHHDVKLLINLLVFLLSVGREDVRGVGIGAVAASVLLLVKSLRGNKHKGEALRLSQRPVAPTLNSQ